MSSLPLDPSQETISLIHDIDMPKPQLINSRKRQRSEQSPRQPLSKRKKYRSPQPQPAFWDNLSKSWLTKRALRELDRRNAQSASNSPSPTQRPHQTLTRHALTELKKYGQPNQLTPGLLYDCSPSSLKDIKLFARHGGPNLTDLRGYPVPMSSFHNQSRSPDRNRDLNFISHTIFTATSPTTGPFDCAFEQNLIDGGVYPHFTWGDGQRPVKPSNLEEIFQRLTQSRSSLSPSKFSQGAYNNFEKIDTAAQKEIQVAESVIPIIEGEIGDRICVSGGIPFENLDHLTNGTLAPGNPGLYDGARPEQLDRQVRTELSRQIIPSEDDLLIVPNFFLAVKGQEDYFHTAHRSLCYDGALGARGMHSLQSWGRDRPVYDNCAYTLTSAYHSGALHIFTSHPVQPKPGMKLEIHKNRIYCACMINSVEQFRQGAAAFRNARDWAREQRDEAINRANARAKASRAVVIA